MVRGLSQSELTPGQSGSRTLSDWTLLCLWGIFFSTLALYQLPATRFDIGASPVPYLVVPGSVALAITILKQSRLDFRRSALELALLGLLLTATLVTGLFHPHQSWFDATKRIAYLALGVGTLLSVRRDPEIMRVSASAFVFTSAAMAIYGFYLLLTGYLEANTLLYWGLHYTPSTRNGDSYFALGGAFLGLYLSFLRWPVGLRMLVLAADAMLWLAVLYSFSRGTWIAAALGLIVVLATIRDARTAIGIAIAVIAAMGVLSIPVRGHHPLSEFVARAATIVSTTNEVTTTSMLPTRRPTVVPTAATVPAPHGDSSSTPTSIPPAPTPATSSVSSPPMTAPASSPTPSGPVTNTNRARLDLLRYSIQLIVAHPLTGVGVDGLNGLKRNGETVGTLEDSYLNAQAEYGLLGLFAMIGTILVPTLRLFPAHRRTDRVLLGGLAAFAVNSITVSAISSSWFWIIPTLLGSIGASTISLRNRGHHGASSTAVDSSGIDP